MLKQLKYQKIENKSQYKKLTADDVLTNSDIVYTLNSNSNINKY